jgi:hypothetical protein
MTCPKVLEDAIEGLYFAFSEYPLPEDTMPCGCCHSPDANELLHAEPLRKLEWKHFGQYPNQALLVWGDLNCFKHFLPRIFDLLLNVSDWDIEAPDPEWVFKKLDDGEWRTWPREEQAAVKKMLQAVWETVLSNPPIESPYIDVEQWLCSIALCEEDIGPYLAQWMEDQRISASWALSFLILGSDIAYVDYNVDNKVPVFREDDGRSKTAKVQEWFVLPHPNAWWKYCSTQYVQLLEWVRSSAVLEKLRQAEIGCGNSEMEREFTTAQRCIREAKSTKFETAYERRLFQTAYIDIPFGRLY